MTLGEKREKIIMYCGSVRCSKCVLRKFFGRGCRYNIYYPEDIETAYAKLVKLGLVSDGSSGMKNPVNEGHIAEQTESDTVKIGGCDYIGIQFDFGWIKGDFPLEGDSDDLLDRLKIVSQIIAAEAESLKRFVDDLE